MPKATTVLETKINDPRQLHTVTPIPSWTSAMITGAMATAVTTMASDAKSVYGDLLRGKDARYALTLTQITHQIIAQETLFGDMFSDPGRATAIVVSSAIVGIDYAQ